mmetsp:Transcript_5275/g.13183  ORF Transcript_5275/g.13183 Transcript_5275/m.13183 type:complete len:80 (-) Transcript_5275:609-848(-)
MGSLKLGSQAKQLTSISLPQSQKLSRRSSLGTRPIYEQTLSEIGSVSPNNPALKKSMMVHMSEGLSGHGGYHAIDLTAL